jgi:hypothetical protein
VARHHPVFADMTDPLKANYWLHVTESKFRLLISSELQNILFAAQQRCGSTSAWWATYTTALQDNQKVSRNEFHTVFREDHILTGIMHCKQREFLDLQQGTDSVYEYIRMFNYLAQYGTYHVDTVEKNAKLFRKGLILPL